MTELFIKSVQLDTAILASLTALAADDSLKDFKEATLLTKIFSELTMDWPNNTTDQLIMGLAYGDATITQIAAAFADQNANVEDGTTWRIQQEAARVIVDFQALHPPVTAGSTVGQSIMWRLPKGGLPSAKGNGWRLFYFNPTSSAFANGPTIVATTKWYFQRLNS